MDIVDELFESDAASSLTNRAAREILRLRELVESAYREGWRTDREHFTQHEVVEENGDWTNSESESKAKL